MKAVAELDLSLQTSAGSAENSVTGPTSAEVEEAEGTEAPTEDEATQETEGEVVRPTAVGAEAAAVAHPTWAALTSCAKADALFARRRATSRGTVPRCEVEEEVLVTTPDGTMAVAVTAVGILGAIPEADHPQDVPEAAGETTHHRVLLRAAGITRPALAPPLVATNAT